MADFEPLGDAEARAFDRFERMRDWALRFRLLHHAARARVRVATAVASELAPSTRKRARRLAALARRMARGYEQIGTLDGAVRFCAAQAKQTAALAKAALRR